MVLWQSSESKLECYRTKSRRCYTQRFCQSSRCTGYRSRKHDRFFCRPVKFRQDRRFLEENTCIHKDDFTGAFLQAGVSELTMACCCLGMALHGGVIAACATFFVFSDYMKPAIRMAALMELPVKFIWTHDAFRVGEDGPTHEPVEQEAQIRLMEN